MIFSTNRVSANWEDTECSTEVILRELTSKFYIVRPHQCLHF